MSFAPKSRKQMPNQYQQIIQDAQDYQDQGNLTSGSEYQLTELDLAILQKLNDIECSLNPICNQHDALMPLLSKSQSLKNLHSIQLEQNQLSKKMITLGQSLAQLSQTLNALTKQLPTHLPATPSPQPLPQLHTSVQRLTSLSTYLKEIELNVNNLQQTINNKSVDASRNIANKMNSIIDDEKEKMQIGVAEVKNEVGLMIKRAQENFNEGTEVNNKKTNQLKEQLTEIENQYLKKINELKIEILANYQENLQIKEKEIGGFKCEIETYFYNKKQKQITELKKKFPSEQIPELNEIEIKQKETEISINDLKTFTDINSTRINSELSQLSEKLGKFEKQSNKNAKPEQLMSLQEEFKAYQDLYQDLEYQIKGMKKQYFFDFENLQQEIDILKELLDNAIEKSILENDNELIAKIKYFQQIADEIAKTNDDKNLKLFAQQQELQNKFLKIKNQINYE